MNGTLKVAAYWQFPFCRRCFWNKVSLLGVDALWGDSTFIQQIGGHSGRFSYEAPFEDFIIRMIKSVKINAFSFWKLLLKSFASSKSISQPNVAKWPPSATTPWTLTLFWNLLLQLLLLLLNVLISFGDPQLECSDLRTLGKKFGIRFRSDEQNPKFSPFFSVNFIVFYNKRSK